MRVLEDETDVQIMTQERTWGVLVGPKLTTLLAWFSDQNQK